MSFESPEAFRRAMDRNEIALLYTGRWNCLDNSSAFAVEWKGKVWPTVDHAYQAAKFMDPMLVDYIYQSRSAHDAKKRGHQFSQKIRSDWDEVKLGIMEEILRAKLAQHEFVRRRLKESGRLVLIEDSMKDSFWGRGPNWLGQNHLGRLWMKLRDEMSGPATNGATP